MSPAKKKRKPGCSMTQPPHSVWSRSQGVRALQCCTGTSVIFKPLKSDLVPPVELGHVANALAREPGLQPERHEESRRAAGLRREPPHRFAVEVVVVVVRDDDGIDMRQIAELQRAAAPRARGPAKPTGDARSVRCASVRMLTPLELQQERGMPDPGQRGLGAVGLEPELRRAAAARSGSRPRESSATPSPSARAATSRKLPRGPVE